VHADVEWRCLLKRYWSNI